MNIQVCTAVRLQYQKLGRFPWRQHEAKANDFDFLKKLQQIDPAQMHRLGILTV